MSTSPANSRVTSSPSTQIISRFIHASRVRWPWYPAASRYSMQSAIRRPSASSQKNSRSPSRRRTRGGTFADFADAAERNGDAARQRSRRRRRHAKRARLHDATTLCEQPPRPPLPPQQHRHPPSSSAACAAAAHSSCPFSSCGSDSKACGLGEISRGRSCGSSMRSTSETAAWRAVAAAAAAAAATTAATAATPAPRGAASRARPRSCRARCASTSLLLWILLICLRSVRVCNLLLIEICYMRCALSDADACRNQVQRAVGLATDSHHRRRRTRSRACQGPRQRRLSPATLRGARARHERGRQREGVGRRVDGRADLRLRSPAAADPRRSRLRREYRHQAHHREDRRHPAAALRNGTVGHNSSRAAHRRPRPGGGRGDAGEGGREGGRGAPLQALRSWRVPLQGRDVHGVLGRPRAQGEGRPPDALQNNPKNQNSGTRAKGGKKRKR